MTAMRARRIRVSIPADLAPTIIKALEDAAENSRALAASFEVCAKTSGEPFFVDGAKQERFLAQRISSIADRIYSSIEREP